MTLQMSTHSPLRLGLLAAGALAAFAFPALAQDAAAPAAEAAAAAPEFASASETAFIFNTLLFLIGGFLVMWMAAGSAVLEAGLLRRVRDDAYPAGVIADAPVGRARRPVARTQAPVGSSSFAPRSRRKGRRRRSSTSCLSMALTPARAMLRM